MYAFLWFKRRFTIKTHLHLREKWKLREKGYEMIYAHMARIISALWDYCDRAPFTGTQHLLTFCQAFSVFTLFDGDIREDRTCIETKEFLLKYRFTTTPRCWPKAGSLSANILSPLVVCACCLCLSLLTFNFKLYVYIVLFTIHGLARVLSQSTVLLKYP